MRGLLAAMAVGTRVPGVIVRPRPTGRTSVGGGRVRAARRAPCCSPVEHDAPDVLLLLACDWLRSEGISRPSVDTLSRRVAAARDGARAETYHRLASLLAPPHPSALNGGCSTSTTSWA